MRLLILAAGLAMICPAETSAQVTKLYPVDEAAQQPGFFSFRARLLQAAQARDTAFLYSTLSPNILNSFGGDGGIAEFKQMWRADHHDSRLWAVLTEILSLGGAFHGDTVFQAPYTSSSFPGTLDGFEHVAIIGSEVRVREQPTTRSAVLATLSFDVVRRRMLHDGEENGWIAVQLADGRAGWMPATYVRSPTDHRVVFVRRNGRWLIGSLVAGD
jgi:hypothetical protein